MRKHEGVPSTTGRGRPTCPGQSRGKGVPAVKGQGEGEAEYGTKGHERKNKVLI